MQNLKSILLNTDSYKVSMLNQYPENTTNVFSYISARGGVHKEVVMFGLSYFLQEYLSKPFTREDIEVAAKIWEAHGEPFPKQKFIDMYYEYNGYLPVLIKAVPEGTPVAVGNVMLTIEATDPKYAFVVTWLETALLRAIWYGSTVATNSREIKKIIKSYLLASADDSYGLEFKLHDFGARGVSSFESAGIAGAAHLINFLGTDTMTGCLFAMQYYGADAVPGFSIPASEHSTITSWTQENEKQAYKNMIKQFGKPGAIFACVSDSYDIFKACEMWGELKQEVQESGATLVIRPDSGDPLEVLPKCVQIVADKFGYTINSKGYKLLNNVRFIWGDGINRVQIDSILRTMVNLHGFSADNFAFGMGGALLQGVTRDDQKFAMKASWAEINGSGVEVFKNPITDSSKKSLRGRLELCRDDEGNLVTLTEGSGMPSAMQVVYRNGQLDNLPLFDDVRARAAI